MRSDTSRYRLTAGECNHGVAARGVSDNTHSRALRIARDARAPVRIGEQCVDDPADLARAFVEVLVSSFGP